VASIQRRNVSKMEEKKRDRMTAKRFSYKLDEIFDEGNHFAYAFKGVMKNDKLCT
jgi:hypothetical protein